MLSGRSSGTRSSPPLCVRWTLLDKRINFAHERRRGRGTGAWWWACCSAAVIWSVSCGILIESEAFQINPETSGLPARATSESRGHTFILRALERAEQHVFPPFSWLLGHSPVFQARLTVGQTQTGPQATSGGNCRCIPLNTSAWWKRENLI